MAKVLFLIMFIFSSFYLSADEKHTLQGKVYDQNGEPVIGATVRIKNTTLGAISKEEGYFEVKNIPHGKLSIIVTAVGYKATEQDVNVTGNYETISVVLGESSVLTSDVVVTGSRGERLYADEPVKVSVIDSKIFESTASVSLQEGLSFQPGLRIENNCANCGTSQVRINGMEGQYSQILIDSRPVYSALNGVYGLEQIPSNMIERVEVMRGGGSALYGGNAIAGVINIITKEPISNSMNASLQRSVINGASTDDNINLNGSFVGNDFNFGGSFFGNYRNRESFDANGDGFTELAEFNLLAFGGRFFYKPTYKSKLNFEFNITDDYRRGGNNLNLLPEETDITEMIEHTVYRANASYERFLKNDKSKLSLYTSFQHTNRDSYYGADQDPNAFGITENYTGVFGTQLTHIINDFAGNHIITTGYEFRNDYVNDFSMAFQSTLSQDIFENGFYIQDDWMMSDRFSLVFGSRFDQHNLVDNVIISPRMNTLFKVTDKFSIRTNIAAGYRAPQAFDEDFHIDLIGGTRQRVVLNENLKEERSLSFTLSTDYNFEIQEFPVSISAEVFRTNLYDAFYFEAPIENESGDRIITKSNGENANVTGVTFEMQTSDINKYFFKIGLTAQRSVFESDIEWSEEIVDDLTGEVLNPAQATDLFLRTPDWYGYLNVSYNLTNNLTMDLSGVLTGPMNVAHYRFEGYELPDRLIKTETFFDLNLIASYRFDFNPELEFKAGVYNLLNQYQNNFDIGAGRDASFVYGPMRPITFFMGIKAGI